MSRTIPAPSTSTYHTDDPRLIDYGQRWSCSCGARSVYSYKCSTCGRSLVDGIESASSDERTESNGELDEDPARFLDTRRFERGNLGAGQGETPAIALAVIRIRGIRSLDVVEKWLDYEIGLPYGPRKKVTSELYTRRAALQEAEA